MGVNSHPTEKDREGAYLPTDLSRLLVKNIYLSDALACWSTF
jgi:hypothetical protein